MTKLMNNPIKIEAMDNMDLVISLCRKMVTLFYSTFTIYKRFYFKSVFQKRVFNVFEPFLLFTRFMM